MRFETLSIHGGKRPDPATGALVTPIYQTSTFVFEDIGKTKGYDYSRSGNPTRKALEDNIALLEGGKSGAAFATGMAAETTVIHLLRHGDHVVCGDDIYGGTYRLFDSVMREFGLEFTFVRMDRRSNIEQAIRPNTRMIWLETPSNPLLNIVDMEMAVDVARRGRILTVADNTFATPYLLRPLEFGVDVVVHSTTKYLNGHCDVVGGAVVTASKEIGDKVQFLLNAMGTGEAPFDAWLVLRGIKTLAPRMRVHVENALRIAEYLNTHTKVKKVYYPGLPKHPGHDIAKRQMKGFGGMVSFELKGGVAAVHALLRNLHLFALAESLGGVESLVEHPATMSHASMPAEARKKAGINDDLVRASIGLENVEDLIEDLESALKAA
ncbi:MAG TPA: PLP-dependent aspartate aminotransferase family protein [Dehalococcoidia bacterium]|nr:PLP-dependent aspartate aminotransferase family protein [Dehalococcoidia bacterium]